MSRKPRTRTRDDETTKWDEPPVWGSAEIPLIPPCLSKRLAGRTVDGVFTVSKDKSQKQVDLVNFTSFDWKNRIGAVVVKSNFETLQELIVFEVEKLFDKYEDYFDLPFFDRPLDDFNGASQMPFELATRERLRQAGLTTDVDVAVLLTGTLREAIEKTGSVRAAIDLAITGSEWVTQRENGLWGPYSPIEPKDFDAAVLLARIRAFRAQGLAPDASFYTERFADVLGRRFGIGYPEKMTLDKCSDILGLTRERIRQIEQKTMWPAAPRAWGRSRVLDETFETMLDTSTTKIESNTQPPALDRESAIDVLQRFGYSISQLIPPPTLEDELADYGIKFSEIARLIYIESERLGFMTDIELVHHVNREFAEVPEALRQQIIAAVPTMSGLPHGYVYIEQRSTSFFRNWMKNLFSALGPQGIDEAYEAAKRFSKVRIPRLVFPPRSVIEEFFRRSSDFWFEEGVVGSNSPEQSDLVGIEKWMLNTIHQSTGKVIHRTKLWDLAREAGVKQGTMNVYASYSLYFKPIPGGFVTITGLVPSETAMEIARSRAQAIVVPTQRESVRVVDGVVTVRLQVGNAMLDGGIFGTTKEIRNMLGQLRFRAMANGSQFGNINWSNSVMIGFSGVLQALRVQPGDVVDFTFSTHTLEMTAEFAS